MSENIEYSIDPLVWFSDRELKYTPKHFTLTRSQLTIESKKWILNNLRGRFSLLESKSNDWLVTNDYDMMDVVPAFEDPQEAILYELMWSS